MKVPKAPRGLQASGRRLWRDLHAPRDDGSVLELRADEVPLLVEVCRLVDDVERIRAELGDELLGIGSQGQSVPHPLRVELHRTTQRMESLVRSLGLPDESPVAASWAGRNLARQRWA